MYRVLSALVLALSLSLALLPDSLHFHPWTSPGESSHRCNALDPQRIVIRPMQAAPSFVNAAAQWLCKTPVRVSQAPPATNALVYFRREQSRRRTQACSGTRELAWLLLLCTRRGTCPVPSATATAKVSYPPKRPPTLRW
jgi:hypothetical protein